MRLIQYFERDGRPSVAAVIDDDAPRIVGDCSSTYELALKAYRIGCSLERCVLDHGLGHEIDYDAVMAERRLRLPLDHPDPSRMVLALTGLTHLGSASSRDAMHATSAGDDLTDSLKMFRMGLEFGKPSDGRPGVQPEWAFKGDGQWAVAPEAPLPLYDFGEDGGEEAEIVGLYVIGDAGEVLRVGYALGNEFSDHVMEKKNYLYLAHSKLRPSSYGPELRLGDLPETVEGSVSITRNGQALWRGEFLSGERHMCHSIANLEHHHFKYPGFRRPGDVHVYFYGASCLSFSDNVALKAGDEIAIASSGFGRPLRNTLVEAQALRPVIVTL